MPTQVSVFVNIFTTVWAYSQLEAITLIFICKSEINDCGYSALATNSPVTASVMTIPTVCLFIYPILDYGQIVHLASGMFFS